MSRFLNRLFSHPKQVCMTYTEHMKFSLGLSLDFAKSSGAAIIHAFLPDYYVTNSSDTIKNITEKMEKVGCRDNNNHDKN